MCEDQLKSDFFLDHPAQVDQRIAHASKRRIDAHFGLFGNILETQPRKVTQHHNLALLGRKMLNQSTDIALDLVADHRVLNRTFGKRSVPSMSYPASDSETDLS